MVTVLPVRLRKRLFSICQNVSPIATVLSFPTTRSVCTVNTQSKSDRLVRRKAVSFCAGGTVNCWLNTAMYSLFRN